MQEWIAEAAMELGSFEDNYGDDQFSPATDDRSSTEDNEDKDDLELCNAPHIFSKYFQPLSQEQHPLRRHHDGQTHTQHYQQAHMEWQQQMPFLVQEYLQWKHRHCDEMEAPALNAGHMLHVDVVSIFDLEYTSCVPVVQKDDELANVSLLHIGTLGCSPTQAIIAIRLDFIRLHTPINYAPSYRRHLMSTLTSYNTLVIP
ncbi:hypothetical protein J3R83DRAFT_7499 [Lanmaoa asiatica]|nr:hypothetical protein J3R83DRAFT_7499 [Lanmaoa asiatica]